MFISKPTVKGVKVDKAGDTMQSTSNYALIPTQNKAIWRRPKANEASCEYRITPSGTLQPNNTSHVNVFLKKEWFYRRELKLSRVKKRFS